MNYTHKVDTTPEYRKQVLQVKYHLISLLVYVLPRDNYVQESPPALSYYTPLRLDSSTKNRREK